MDRTELISNAIQFIQDPSVQSTPLTSRVAFLERKGLSNEEIDSVLAKLNLERPGKPSTPTATSSTYQPQQPTSITNGPPARLQKMALERSFNWTKVLFYVALATGTAVTLGKSTILKWIRFLYVKALRQWNLLFGQNNSHISSPTVSIDRIGDLREELSQIKSSMNSLKKNVEETIQEEVQRVNNSLRMAYTKLEGDIEELKEDLVTIKAQEEIFSRSMSTEINV